MAYGREQLRKAGEALSNFFTKVDDAYSAKIVDMYMGPKDNPRSYTDNPMLGAAAGMAAAFGGGMPLSKIKEMQHRENKIAAATGAVAKYGAPAVGIGMAVKGAADIYGGFADQQEPNQLSM